MSEIKIRFANEEDSTAILEIYAPFIMDTVITFETQVPTIEDFRNRMMKVQKKYPWLVCEINNTIVGYAYASRYSERAAYDWSVDYSVYINPEYHRRNLGNAMYFALSEILKIQGYCNAYACITSPNSNSERFHESLGFKPIGVFHKAGYKFSSWHDIKWYEYTIREHPQLATKPEPISLLNKSKEIKTVFEKAEQMVKGRHA